MKADTETLLSRFQHCDWFIACGTYEGEEFERIKSKSIAIKSLVSHKWNKFATSLANRFQMRVFGNYGENKDREVACDEIYWTTLKLISEPLDAAISCLLISDEATKGQAHQRILFDVLATLREAEFADVVPPLIHVPILLPVYLSGHLPCGWTGKSPPYDWSGRTLADLPPGKIRVY